MSNKMHFFLWIVILFALSSCVKEDLSNCPEPEQGIILSYRYELNMDYADKFAEQVENLQAFIFDKDGILRDTLIPFVGNGMIVPNWERRVNLPPGDYSIVTWAGSKDFYAHYYWAATNEDTEGFLPGVTIGKTQLEEMRAFLKYEPLTETSEQKKPYDANLKDLYHGIEQNITVLPEEFTAVNTPLIKNTNTIRVRIDGLSNLGDNIDNDDFELTITGSNGHYRYNNTIGEKSSTLRYTPWQNSINGSSLHADIRTLRLMYPESDPFGNASLTLNIRYEPLGLQICRDVNLVDLILSGKIPARDAQGNLLTDSQGNQEYTSPTLEYLDRQDLFEIVYEITKNPNGGSMIITVYVNDWKITNIYPV